MNKFKSYFLALLVMVAVIAPACNLEETNIDPTRVNDVNLNLVLPAALSQTAFNQSGNNARITGIIMQQFVGFDAQQVAYTNYNIPEDVFNNYWRTGLYAGILKDCIVIIDKAQAEGQPYYEGIAKILMAESYGTAAVMFGDIPLTEALQGAENLNPAYDTQESVLNEVQNLLDEAIELLGQAAVAGGPAGDDIIFGGDADAWIATAQAFKARYFILLTKKDAANAQRALTAANAAFSSIAGQPDFAWESSQIANNPLAKFGIERSNTLVIDDGFYGWMNDRNDPRISSYMFPRTTETTDPDGNVTIDTTGWSYHGDAGMYWAQNTSVIPLISYVEIAFIQAEALARTGAATADVEAALEAAITASMTQLGVEDAGGYAAAQAALDGLSGEEVIQRIMEEAYVSFYGVAFIQTWTNYLRTGYPALTPKSNSAEGLNPSGVIPRRFLYPVSEVQTNRANVQAAKDRQNGALLDATTWAFQ